jgi:glycogen debranching enzyme
VGVESGQVTILDGSTFVVSDGRGDVDAGPAQVQGLFYRDMRHLSTWRLLLDGRPLEALASDLVEYDCAAFFLVVPTGTVYASPTVSLIRRRTVGDGMREELTVRNSSGEAVSVQLMMVFGSDFADIFEVKDAETKKGRLHVESGDGSAVLSYTRGDFGRQTTITAPGAVFSRGSFMYPLVLEPGQSWTGEITVTVGEIDASVAPKPRSFHSAPTPNMDSDLAQWVAAAPSIDCDWDGLRHIYERSITDLAALRFYPDVVAGTASLPAAGLPWFMALFGRDSLITSYQALPFVPELAATTLRALAARQANKVDDFRDAEPGKILHELRFGELTHFRERPQSPYYGSADATPLFLILLDEYERWTGDRDLVRSLEQPARAALGWIENYGDRDGDGYLEYERRNQQIGLENQCWKDSWNSIVHPDGSLASLPRATCELQGYAYDARRRTARLAREVWSDEDLAARLDDDAAELKRRFNTDFWLEDEQYFALALDGQKKPVRTITSNPGHLLWSGIVEDDRVDAVTSRLMGDDLFSGWGVRTLAAGQGSFNPLEYHNGTVWPHDNSLVAAGLARYGKHAEAARIAHAILDAARTFDYRLPEAFAGYPRAETGFPVPYPSACSPQAWASGTPLLLLTVLLGLDPTPAAATNGNHVPPAMGRICLRNVRTPTGLVTVNSG